MPAGELLVKILGVNKDLVDAVEGASKSIAGLENKFKAVGERMSKVGTTMTKSVTLPILAAGGALLALGGKFDDAFDTIRVGTGATGEALQGLKDEFLAVYKAVPVAMEDAAWMTAEFNTRLGYTSEELRRVSESTALLAKVTGVDLKTAVAGISDLTRVYNLNAQETVNIQDVLFRATQMTGIGIDKLSSDLKTNAATFKLLGYDITQATGLLATLEKHGVESSAVMSSLGISIKRAAAAGQDIPTFFAGAIESIKSAKTESEAAGIAVDVFGRQGAQMAVLIREGKFSIDEMTTALITGKDTIKTAAAETFDYGEKLALLKQNIAVEFLPVAMRLFDTINSLIPVFQSVAGSITVVLEAFGKLSPQVQTAILGFIGFLAVLGPLLTIISKLIASKGVLVGAFKLLISPVGLAVVAIAGLVVAGILLYRNWETISSKAKEIWGGISAFFTKTIGGWITNAFAWGSNLLQGFIDGIKSKISAVTDAFTNIAKKIKALLGFGSPTEMGPGKYADEWIPNLMKMFIGDIERFTPQLQTKLAMALPTITPHSPGQGMAKTDTNYTVNVSQLVVREEADIERISKHLFNLIQASVRGGGYSGI